MVVVTIINCLLLYLDPQVMFLDYDVLIDDDNALLIINAEVFPLTCTCN